MKDLNKRGHPCSWRWQKVFVARARSKAIAIRFARERANAARAVETKEVRSHAQKRKLRQQEQARLFEPQQTIETLPIRMPKIPPKSYASRSHSRSMKQITNESSVSLSVSSK